MECPGLLYAHLDQVARGVAHRGLLALISGEQLVDERDGRRQLAVRLRPLADNSAVSFCMQICLALRPCPFPLLLCHAGLDR